MQGMSSTTNSAPVLVLNFRRLIRWPDAAAQPWGPGGWVGDAGLKRARGGAGTGVGWVGVACGDPWV